VNCGLSVRSSCQRCSAPLILVKDDVTGRVANFTRLFRALFKPRTITYHALHTIYRCAQDTHYKHLILLRLALPHTANRTMHLLHTWHTAAAPIAALSIKRPICKYARRTLQQTIYSPDNDPTNSLHFLPQCAPRGAPTKRALHNRPLRLEARVPPTTSPRTSRHAPTIRQKAR
jgi:hypothetical protein